MNLNSNNYQNAALVLAGHGSTVNLQSSLPVRTLVSEFQRTRAFGRVVAGFWKEEPPLSAVLNDVSEERVFVVPFFVSDGYFAEQVAPFELGLRKEGQREFDRVQRRGGQTYYYCQPVGTHEGMTNVILSRARSVVDAHPFPRQPSEKEITLFIAGHGTGLNTRSRQSVERQVDLIRVQEIYADVHAVFMEESPRIADWHQLAPTRYMVMVPFFLSDGLHVVEDIPVLLGEPERVVRGRLELGQATWRNPTEKQGKLVWYSSAVGSDPVIAQVILDRVREAEGRVQSS